MWRKAKALAFALMTGFSPLAAQEALLVQADRLILAGDTGAARAAVQSFVPADAEEAIHARWLMALSYMREDAPRAALPHLEWLVTNAPEVPRFRLELARALFMTEDNIRARHHFERALAGELALGEIAAVAQYLDAMESRKPWHSSARVAVVTQTNPHNRSGETEVALNGSSVIVPLPEIERETGLELALSGTYRPRIGQDLFAHAQITATTQIFEESALNRLHLGTELGVVQMGDQQRVGTGLALQAAFGQGGRLMHGIGVYAEIERKLDQRTTLGARANVDRLRYRDTPAIDGVRGNISLHASRLLSPQAMVQARFSYTKVTAARPHNARETVTAAIGGNYLFRGGVQAGLEGQVSQTRHKEANPLLQQFGPERSTALSVTTRLSHRGVNAFGFAPVVILGFETQSSNVPMRAYDNLRLSVGATRAF